MVVVDRTLGYASALAAEAFDREEGWREGMRAAVASCLDFLDAQPQVARVTVVEILAAGPRMLDHREDANHAFRELVVTKIEGDVPHVWPLAARTMFASVLGAVHMHLATRSPDPIVTLLPGLMGTLTAPFLTPSELEREVASSQGLAERLIARRAAGRAPLHDGWAGPVIPQALANPRSHRTRRALRHIAGNPGATSSQTATATGVRHPSQISSILARLHRHGLIHGHSDGPGHPTHWHLTAHGHRTLQALPDERP